MSRVLVPDYFGQQVLAAIRALRRGGDACDLATWSRAGRLFFFRSRAVSRTFRVPDPERGEDEFVDCVLAICGEREYEYDLVLPCGLSATRAVVSRQEEVRRRAAVVLPSLRNFEIAEDKLRVARLCRDVGIPCPRTFEVRDARELRVAAREVGYPVVLKTATGSGVVRGLRYASDESELEARLGEISAENPDLAARGAAFIVQEFIPGFIHDACALSRNGRVLNVLTQERRLMFPITGGVGAVAVTTREPELAAIARKLLESLDWHGPAQVEFKLDPRDGVYKLIEMNPKLWGTLDLSIRAGMDFPGMIRDLALGREVAPDRPYTEGLRYRFWFPQASIGYLQMIRRLGLRAALDPERYQRTFSDVTWRDPGPLLFFIYSTLTSLLDRANCVTSNLDSAWINRLEKRLPRC